MEGRDYYVSYCTLSGTDIQHSLKVLITCHNSKHHTDTSRHQILVTAAAAKYT